MVSLKLHITLDNFLYALKNGITNDKNTITIEQAFKETIRAKSSLSKCTVSKYNSTLVYIKDFIKQEYGRSDIFVEEITPNTCQLFFNYLLSKVSNNTAIYRLKHLNSVMIYCRDEGYIQTNPCKVKFRKDKLEYHPLTKEQLDRLKTKIQSVIPILDTAKEILEKYDYHLPALSNQKYNSYLKELGDICDIEQELHTHLARHSISSFSLKTNDLQNLNLRQVTI